MKQIFYPLLITSILILTSCKQNKEKSAIDTEFYIPVEKSNLFIRLVGNPNKPIIIDLHGGPGGFSGFSHEIYAPYLENDYLLVYLDQRGSGRSDISNDSTLLTTQQFVKDLDVVVDTLQNRYPNKNINLLGTSWGGTYGLLYLIDHQDKITSFACTSGKANSVYQNISLIEHEEELAKKFLAKTNNPKDKKLFDDMLTKLSEIKNSGFKDFYTNMNLIKHKFPKKLGFSPYKYEKEDDENKKLLDTIAVFKRANYTPEMLKTSLEKMEIVNKQFRNTPSYNNLNIIDEMNIINKPVIVLQGEYDYAVGIKQGEMIYNALKGVPEENKELHIIPNTAHNLKKESVRDEYFNLVKTFFDRHN
ncbi:alpha/beta fold hydrolase [uncultured Aquimarina sp.]|uniref:alpha/beta fold hydrolase n=1 Tax=uncultured Aquimarina sp. TaxID=575652 RepID=UPI0026229B02|nr:alpha/beta fold hydrolase [uncultured Aquimarina sp.]